MSSAHGARFTGSIGHKGSRLLRDMSVVFLHPSLMHVYLQSDSLVMRSERDKMQRCTLPVVRVGD